jgi:perosamine synthetase
LALKSLDLKKNEEVIVPNITFASPINVLINLNLKPKIVDIDKNSFCLDKKLLIKSISKKTRAVILVHLFGFCSDVLEISRICRKNNIFLIEDCAESLGSFFNDKHTGNFGDIGTFSFYGNKTITTGEGGMVTFKNKKFFTKAVLFKNHGMDKKKRYLHLVPGLNFRMTNVQAALGCAQMKKIDLILKKKKDIHELYKKKFNKLKKFCYFLDNSKNETSSNWLTIITIKNFNKKLKNKLIKFISSKKIEVRDIFIPLSYQDIYRKFKYSKNYPASKEIYNSNLCLPNHAKLTKKNIDYIFKIFKSFFNIITLKSNCQKI